MAGLGVIIPAAVAGIGAIASGVSNLVSQADTNNTNWAIHQSQLAYAREQYEREKAENRYLIQSQRDEEARLRAYNSPEQESQRLFAAGINPALAKYGGLGSSQATTIAGVGSPAKMSIPDAPQMSPLRYDFISQATDSWNRTLADSQMQEAQIAAVKRHSENEYIRTLNELENSKIDREQKRDLMTDLHRNWTFENETWDSRAQALRIANDSIKENTRKVQLENQALRFANEIAPEMHDLEKMKFVKEMSRIEAEIADVYARRDLTLEQKKYVTKQVVEQELINKNLPKSMHNDNAIKVATYKEVNARAALINQQKETENWRTKDVERNTYIHAHDNQRPLSDYVEDAIKKSKKIRK